VALRVVFKLTLGRSVIVEYVEKLEVIRKWKVMDFLWCCK
jgi:hypothetical protein